MKKEDLALLLGLHLAFSVLLYAIMLDCLHLQLRREICQSIAGVESRVVYDLGPKLRQALQELTYTPKKENYYDP